MENPKARYNIIRFKQGDASEVVKENVTLEEAQNHCTQDDTHGWDWFDGYIQLPSEKE